MPAVSFYRIAVFHCFQVILANPAKKEARPLLKLAESFYVHAAPLRMGLVFAVNPDQSVTGNMDAGVALLNAFNYVSEVKDAYSGLAFITDVSLQIYYLG